MTKLEPSFKQAIEFSAIWLKAWEAGELSDEVMADRIAELIASQNGARGFFAISLSVDSPLLDRLPEPVVVQLRIAGDRIIDLTIKNLAMSSAMAITHKRNTDNELQNRSERIAYRCIEILRLLEPNAVKCRLENLLAAIEGRGLEEDIKFLEKWQYDNDQKLAIASNIIAVATQ